MLVLFGPYLCDTSAIEVNGPTARMDSETKVRSNLTGRHPPIQPNHDSVASMVELQESPVVRVAASLKISWC